LARRSPAEIKALKPRRDPVFPNAPSGLALRKLEHLILLQQGIHGFPEQILLGPTVFFRELVQQFNLHVIQIQSHLGS
jgi:hypothetical protein